MAPQSEDLSMPSSPPPVLPSSPPQRHTTKISKPASITPRRFRRFFTPRSALRENPNLSGGIGHSTSAAAAAAAAAEGSRNARGRNTTAAGFMSNADKEGYVTSSPPKIGTDAMLPSSDDVENLSSTPIKATRSWRSRLSGPPMIFDGADDEDDDAGKDGNEENEENEDAVELPTSPVATPNKRRRIETDMPPSSPPLMMMSSSPLKRFDIGSSPASGKIELPTKKAASPSASAKPFALLTPETNRSPSKRPVSTPAIAPAAAPAPPKPISGIRRSKALLNPGPVQLLNRAVSGTRATKFALAYPGNNNGWQDDVERFYSGPEDMHPCTHDDDEYMSLPLCTAACNTNSLVAIGEEGGRIRLVDPSSSSTSPFSEPHLTFQPHVNAILDLEFSSNDAYLATAAGDQTCRIIDMPTQTPIATLKRHTSSLKKVCWQEGSGDQVLATCGRDGGVALWDLRCKSVRKPVMDVLGGNLDETSRVDRSVRGGLLVKEYSQPLNFIAGAHSEKLRVRKPYAHAHSHSSSPLSAPSPLDLTTPASTSDTSITSLAFLPAPRSNLLITSGASNACLRLWDLRTTYALRRKAPVPLSVTAQPEKHARHRDFGITSMAWNTDGTRLFALCRDSTIYAYSTQHLVLENCAEMQGPGFGGNPGGDGFSGSGLGGSGFKHFPGEEARAGMGPLYGLRHPRLQVSSFFIKLALRKETPAQREVLAAGSSDNCAVLFSTDERYMRRKPAPSTPQTPRRGGTGVAADPATPFSRRSTLRASTLSQSPSHNGIGHPTPPPTSALRARTPGSSARNGTARGNADTLPFHTPGLALTNGHRKEVSALIFAHTGELVTVSDDNYARCWREDEAGRKAWETRTFGARESSGSEGGCGWADVEGAEGEGWRDDEGRSVGALFSDMSMPVESSQESSGSAGDW